MKLADQIEFTRLSSCKFEDVSAVTPKVFYRPELPFSRAKATVPDPHNQPVMKTTKMA